MGKRIQLGFVSGWLWVVVQGEKARERLRAQVRHFVEFLQKEGVVEATGKESK